MTFFDAFKIGCGLIIGGAFGIFLLILIVGIVLEPKEKQEQKQNSQEPKQ